jgi:hypothetical protein
MAHPPKHLKDIFTDSDYRGCPPLTAKMVKAAEAKLGYRLPKSYVELLKVKNGGYLTRKCYPTTRCPRWADDHVAFDFVHGISADKGIDSRTGSQYLIREWGYPDVGVVISGDGHTAFMLDYSKCGTEGEPRVIWVDVETGGNDPYVAVLAPDFSTFLSKLLEHPPGEGGNA